MNSMVVQTTLAILLLCVASVEASDGRVDFWGLNFIMTCPYNGTWYYGSNDKAVFHGREYSLEYGGQTKGEYSCKSVEDPEKIYKFYVKGKACKDCFELSADLVGVIISLDLVGTVIIMTIIYKCTKKKTLAARNNSSTAPPRSRGRTEASRQPDQHYEALNAQTRSQDPYSTVNQLGSR